MTDFLTNSMTGLSIITAMLDNYLILLINQVYDIPAVTTDNIEMMMHLMRFTATFYAVYVM